MAKIRSSLSWFDVWLKNTSFKPDLYHIVKGSVNQSTMHIGENGFDSVDIVIAPDLSGIRRLNISDINKIINIGKQVALDKLEQIKKPQNFEA